MNTDHSNRLLKPVLWAVLGLTLVTALLLQARLVANLDFEGENSGAESGALYGLLCARDGRAVYRDMAVSPHTLTQYMPLFYLVPGWFARAAQAGDFGTFLIGRCEVWVSWLGIAVVIYTLARQAGCGRSSSAFVASLWLASRLAHHWAVSFRPDAVALLLSLSALGLYRKRADGVFAGVVVLLLVAAFFHKQSSVAALAAVVAEECLCRRWRRATLFGGGWLAAVFVGLFAAQHWSDGLMIDNTFRSLSLMADRAQMVELLRGALTLGTISLLGGAIACIVVQNPASRWLRIYFLFSFGLAVATSVKAGAYTNYYLEPLAVGCVLTAVLIEDWGQRPAAGRATNIFRVGWLGIASAATMLGAMTSLAQVPSWAAEITNHAAMRQRERNVLADALRSLPGPVLAEDPYLAIRQSRTPYLIDPSSFAEAQRQGKFDDRELVRRIEAGEFAAIVLISPMDGSERLFSERWIAAMHSRYVLSATHFIPDRRGLTWYVYRVSST